MYTKEFLVFPVRGPEDVHHGNDEYKKEVKARSNQAKVLAKLEKVDKILQSLKIGGD